jgi:deoxyribodipyrimidine photo-lyase
LPIIDAAMRQLLETGWMHNRLRMLVAMFLTKNLLIDWREGERFFMRHLIDGDLAANNGGWQWSASTGTDSAPWFRIFNPLSQSEKFDTEGLFIKHWLPELAGLNNKSIHNPATLGGLFGAVDYPLPIVDLGLSRERALAAFKHLPSRLDVGAIHG